MPTRWFEQESIAFATRCLMQEVVESCKVISSSQRARYSERRLSVLNWKTGFFLVGVVAFILAVIYVPTFLPGEWLAKDGNLQSVTKWIVAAVPIGFGVRAKQRMKRANKRAATHESAIDKLTGDYPTLRSARHSPIVGAYTKAIPHLHTDCKTKVHCNLFGEYRGHALAMLEAEYQPLAQIDMKHILDKVQANLLKDTDREQFKIRRVAEVILFIKPLSNPPDLFAAGKQEQLSAFQSRWVTSAGGRPKDSLVRTPLGDNLQAFSSCPGSAAPLFTPELTELFIMRPGALIQIIGGFVAVVPRTWDAVTPMSTAVKPFEVQLDLDFACAVYENVERALQPTARHLEPSH